MAIIVNSETRVITQGITGRTGAFHTRQCLEYGTNVVGGVVPGKGGQTFEDTGIPIFNTVEEAVSETGANATMVFVPPPNPCPHRAPPAQSLRTWIWWWRSRRASRFET